MLQDGAEVWSSIYEDDEHPSEQVRKKENLPAFAHEHFDKMFPKATEEELRQELGLDG